MHDWAMPLREDHKRIHRTSDVRSSVFALFQAVLNGFLLRFLKRLILQCTARLRSAFVETLTITFALLRAEVRLVQHERDRFAGTCARRLAAGRRIRVEHLVVVFRFAGARELSGCTARWAAQLTFGAGRLVMTGHHQVVRGRVELTMMQLVVFDLLSMCFEARVVAKAPFQSGGHVV